MAQGKAAWNELPCPLCRQPLHYAATRCHHCHADIAPEIVRKRVADHKATTRGCLIATAVVVPLLLGYCAYSAPDPVPAPDPAPVQVRPTSYHFDAGDMMADPPLDICRSRNRDFARDLIGRAMRATAGKVSGIPRVEDFTVHDAAPGQPPEAVFRFRATSVEGEELLFSAIGSFDPANCTVGRMRGGVGPDPLAPDFVVTLTDM